MTQKRGQFNPADPTLGNVRTRILLDWLAKSRKFGGKYTPNDHHYFTTEEIKKELNTREHIPRGKEAKELRKEKARAKRHR